MPLKMSNKGNLKKCLSICIFRGGGKFFRGAFLEAVLEADTKNGDPKNGISKPSVKTSGFFILLIDSVTPYILHVTNYTVCCASHKQINIRF